jgi:SH3-like domain-containing protein
MLLRFFLCISLLVLGGCGGDPERERAIGEGFAGPATLQIREELTVRAKVTATLKHGESVEIIARRRKFYKVRTRSGAEGWLDGRLLLSAADMQGLERQREKAAKLPSMGSATVFDPVNVHIIPNRLSPSSFLIVPGAKIEVLAAARAPRVPYESKIALKPTVVVKPPPKKKKEETKTPPPPPGPAPGLVENWMELSGNPQLKNEMTEAESVKAAIPVDDWSLVRSQEGKAGWVLTRLLLMGVPDEIAQYAERARITSYFILDTPAGPDPKPTYLWTTLSSPGADWQFDSARVFSYNARKQRYETAFIERRLQGYYPVMATARSTSGPAGFSLLVDDASGTLLRKYYGFQGPRVRLLKKEAAERPEPFYRPAEPGASEEDQPDIEETPQGVKARVKALVDALRKKLNR